MLKKKMTKAEMARKIKDIRTILPNDFSKQDLSITAILLYIITDDISCNPWLSMFVAKYIKYFPEHLRSIAKPCFRVVQDMNRVITNVDNARKQGFFSTTTDYGSAHLFLTESHQVSVNVNILTVDYVKALYAIDIKNFIKDSRVMEIYKICKLHLCNMYTYRTPIAFLRKRVRNEQEQILVFPPNAQMYCINETELTDIEKLRLMLNAQEYLSPIYDKFTKFLEDAGIAVKRHSLKLDKFSKQTVICILTNRPDPAPEYLPSGKRYSAAEWLQTYKRLVTLISYQFKLESKKAYTDNDIEYIEVIFKI